MRILSRLKLLLGALLVVALVAVLTRHLDQQMSTVHDLSATLRSQEYALGTDYAGILADQYVESGDEVAAGDPIAVIKSNLLSRDIANGLVDAKTSPYEIRDANTLVLRATSAGTVTSAPFIVGAFIPAGTGLVQVRVKSTTYVEARFLLTTQEYAEIRSARTVTVTLPNDDQVAATITGVSVRTRGNRAATSVTATATELADDPLFAAGTPVDVQVRLPKDGLITTLGSAVTGLLSAGEPTMRLGAGSVTAVGAAVVLAVTATAVVLATGAVRGGGAPTAEEASRAAVPSGWTRIGGDAPEGWTAATSTLPAVRGEVGPARVAPDLPAPTNRWYSGMLFGDTPQPVFAEPLALLAEPDGVSIGLPVVTATPATIAGPFTPGLRLGLPATTFAATRADPVSLTATYSSDGHPIGRLQVAEGWPYVAYTAEKDQSITLPSGLDMRDEGRWAGVEVGDTTYGVAVVGPDGEPLDVDPSGETLRLGVGQSVLAFGAPDAATATTLADGAVPITGTTVSYRVADDAVGTRITYDTIGGRPTVVAAMPHHRLDEPASPVGAVDSVYGPLQLYRGRDLVTDLPAVTPRGVLDLRGVSEADRAELRTQVVADIDATVDGPAAPTDSYFGGKAAYRLAQLYRLAVSVGADDAAGQARTRLVADLDTWLDPGPCSTTSTRCFTYDRSFRGVVGRIPSFGSEVFNDHHFHYGYFLAAAALVADLDPSLVDDWRPTLDALADDIAAPYASGDGPALRTFDPYAGHSWASGLSPFADGNNQESSSEAVSAWNGLALWAQVAGDDERARQASWQLSVESATAAAYWLQPSRLPAGYAHPFVSLNWGGKRDWATWFSADPAAILGIQLIPMPPTFVETDPDPARVRANLADATPDGYRVPFGDYLTMYLATVDPGQALRIGRTLPAGSIDDGNSRSYLLAWLLTQ